jgi:hypothetical protein
MTISHVSSKLKNGGFCAVWNFPSLIEDKVKLSVAPSFNPSYLKLRDNHKKENS